MLINSDTGYENKLSYHIHILDYFETFQQKLLHRIGPLTTDSPTKLKEIKLRWVVVFRNDYSP